MGEEEIVAELEQLSKSTERSKTARLRDLYDQIEMLRKRGFTHATIVNALKKHGLEFDVKTFEVTFYRIKRQRAKKLLQPPGMMLVAVPEEVSKNETEEIAKVPTRMTLRNVTKSATQEELKAIARGHVDPNQYIDE